MPKRLPVGERLLAAASGVEEGGVDRGQDQSGAAGHVHRRRESGASGVAFWFARPGVLSFDVSSEFGADELESMEGRLASGVQSM